MVRTIHTATTGTLLIVVGTPPLVSDIPKTVISKLPGKHAFWATGFDGWFFSHATFCARVQISMFLCEET
jgi:hypothetical protein